VAKTRNKRLSKLQKKELAGVLVFLGIDSVVSAEMVLSDHRATLWSYYKRRLDYHFSFRGNRVLVGFSEYKGRSISELKQVNPIVKIEKTDLVFDDSEPKRKTRGKGKSPVKKILSIALEPELLERLKAHALEDDRSLGSLVRIAIKKYFND
jgi:hypothetical protein